MEMPSKPLKLLIASHNLCGSYPDEFESTRIIGERQFRKAVDLFNGADEEIEGGGDFRHAYIDFSQLEVTISDQGYSEVVKTCPAAMGFAFAAGTTDGPGAFDFQQGDDKVIIVLYLMLAHYPRLAVLNISHGVCLLFVLIHIRAILSGSWSVTCLRLQAGNK